MTHQSRKIGEKVRREDAVGRQIIVKRRKLGTKMHYLVPCVDELRIILAIEEVMIDIPLFRLHPQAVAFGGLLQMAVISFAVHDRFVEAQQRFIASKHAEEVGAAAPR